MTTMTKRWQEAPRIPPNAENELDRFHPVMRQILYNRGFATHDAASQFLDANPPQNTDPLQLLDMPKAVERIDKAIKTGESIVVYGDYDADGVSSTALMVETLSALKANVTSYIPNRFDEGYGLNNEALDSIKKKGVSLVITVDCGIRAIEPADHAAALGLDLIITDHHHSSGRLPEAYAVINPKRPGDPYPDKDLAGVGTAYKLASALIDCLAPHNFTSEDVLDLVAIGTVADMVPLVGENRAIVRAGLERIRRPQRQGLMSLMGVADLRPAIVSSTHIGFVIGPRLNAAGRLDSALSAYQLLTTQDVLEAGLLAQKLDNQNRERQKLMRSMQAQVEEIALAKDTVPFILFASDPEFSPGVVGLAASRLVDQYYRPALVAHQGDEVTRGSCRSIQEFHITEALDKCTDLLTHHGGHAAAAGFTVPNEKVSELVERLEAIASEQLAEADLRPILHADAEVPLADLNLDLLKEMDRLQPTGYGNPEPFFITRNLRVVHARPVGKDRSHLKFTVTGGRKYFDAIAFRQGHWHGEIPPRIDVIYNFQQNEFQGRVTLQLNVKDIKPSTTFDPT